jgi:hypothetical protein
MTAPLNMLTDEALETFFDQNGDNKGQGLDTYYKKAVRDGFNLARGLLSASKPAVPQQSGVEHFNYLCSLLPEGFHWSDPLTPGVLSHIVSAAAPAQSGEPVVPANVMAALDRMCTPLDESVLKGATAEADAHSMKLIRDYLLCVPQTAQTERALTDEQIRRAMILTPAFSDDADYAHWIRMGRAVLALAAQPACGDN